MSNIKFTIVEESEGERPVRIRAELEMNDDGSVDILAHNDEDGEMWYVARLDTTGTLTRFDLCNQGGTIPFELSSDDGIKVNKGAI